MPKNRTGNVFLRLVIIFLYRFVLFKIFLRVLVISSFDDLFAKTPNSFEQNLPLPLSGFIFQKTAVTVSFLCTLIVHSLPVKAESLDSISDNCLLIEIDNDSMDKRND